jgi:hypothetical protein
LLWQLVKAGGGEPTTRTLFPTYKVAPKKESDFLGKVEGAGSAAINIIKALQPYNCGDDSLWKLHELDIRDKHHSLLMVACRVDNASVDIRPSPSPQSALIQVTAPTFPGGGFPILEDGTELFRATAGFFEEMHKDFNVSFEVAFGEPQVAQGQPALPLLHQLAGLVEGIVNQLAPFL